MLSTKIDKRYTLNYQEHTIYSYIMPTTQALAHTTT